MRRRQTLVRQTASLVREPVALAGLALLIGPGGALLGGASAAGDGWPAGGLAAQEPPVPSGDTITEPAMAPTPRLFRLAASAGVLAWRDESGRNEIDAAPVFGLEIESRVGPWLAFRLGGAYGLTTIVAAEGVAQDGLDAAALETTDAGQYLIDLAVVPRLGLPALERAGVVPYAAVGVGAVVHDPEAEELVTRSQNALGFGGGVDVDLGGAFGARAEWRRYLVNAEDALTPEDREGDERAADRFWGALYWKL